MLDLPKEFSARMKSMLNGDFDAFIASFDKDKFQGLRINTLKTDGEIVKKTFSLRPVEWCEQGYYFGSDERPGKSVLHECGAYYIQEPSAMAVAENLDVQDGESVLDLCAAPGGKSTQIACALNSTGLLVANEIVPSRAKILAQNIERMGIRNCIVLNESPKSLAERFVGIFDKILVDAPCSGEGMFRKNSLAIDEWSQEGVKLCKVRQLDILAEAVKMLKSGGRIVYSTCTFSKEENEEVVDEFLSKYPDFEVLPSKYKFCNGFPIDGGEHNDTLALTNRIFPHKFDGEGHFFAILQHKGKREDIKYSLQSTKISGAQIKIFNDWQKENLTEDIVADLSFGDNLYAMPKGTPRLDRLKVERAGLHLGIVKKNRFEPSHSLALALKPSQVKRILDLSEEDATKFIGGQTLSCDGEKGWTLMMYGGISVGWSKCDGSYAKNHYPKGIRK
ncbi:MAG: RsmF rRNA methyltransferase first C-terminal domain-containing protein [Clostridia bacterium]|nr:RsmF rRNA methyltransferase first C-terminal domain-containing protein [Clostridia bacterium]